MDSRAPAVAAAALGVAVLAGCTAHHPAPLPSASPSPSPSPPDPDAAMLAGWRSRELRLAAAYDASAARLPKVAKGLKALGANHSRRATEVAARVAMPAPGPVRTGPLSLAALLRLELAAVTAYLGDLGHVVRPDLAVLGAELAAGAREHATLLRLL